MLLSLSSGRELAYHLRGVEHQFSGNHVLTQWKYHLHSAQGDRIVPVDNWGNLGRKIVDAAIYVRETALGSVRDDTHLHHVEVPHYPNRERRVRKFTITLIAGAMALAACSTSDPDEATDTTSAATEETTAGTTAPESTDPADTTDATATTTADTTEDTTEGTTADTAADTTVPSTDAPTPTFPPVEDGRQPGVTDTAVKVGVIYLDLSSAGPILGINQGDYQAAYQAAFDEVNEAGGVNGRMLEPVFTPIVPASDDQGTAACTALTQDDPVFVVLGNYVDENAPCIVTTHETPLLGGDLAMNEESMANANALWYAVGGGAGQQNAGLQELVDRGLLDGKVGVVGALGLETLYENGPKQILEEGGVNVVDVAYLDIISGASDPNALFAASETIALKFESEGIDQIIFNTGAGRIFPNGLARTDYRPQLLFDSLGDVQLYSNGEGSDLSVMENAVAVGAVDSGNLFPTMGGVTEECVASQEAATRHHHPPVSRSSRWRSRLLGEFLGRLSARRPRSPQMLEAAGPELNWGTFTSAGWNLGEVELAGGLDPFFFSKDSPNGSPSLYLYNWDPAASAMVLAED